MTDKKFGEFSDWKSLTADDWRRAISDPVFFTERLLQAQPHEGQKLWLRNASAQQNLLVTGNRWGKSFIQAVRALHAALFQLRNTDYDRAGRYRVLTASITQDQAGIIFHEAVRLARNSPVIEPLIQEITRSPFPKLMFGNGSTIEARSTQNRGEYLLGNDYDLFIFDEVAFEPHADYIIEEVVQMRLADRRGRLDLVSTPNGKNWFYHKMRELADSSSNGYVQSGDSRENSFISQEYLVQRIELFSADRVAQNIMGQFVDSGQEIVPSEFVDKALERYRNADRPTDGNGSYHISGWDLARKRTATVGVTVSVSQDGHAVVIAVERFKLMDWNYVFEKIRKRQERYPGRLIVDATGLGDVVISELSDLAPTPFLFTEKTKAALLTNLELMHVKGRLSYGRNEIRTRGGNIWALEDELRGATWNDNGRFDGVMAFALALWPLAQKSETRLVDPRLALL